MDLYQSLHQLRMLRIKFTGSFHNRGILVLGMLRSQLDCLRGNLLRLLWRDLACR